MKFVFRSKLGFLGEKGLMKFHTKKISRHETKESKNVKKSPSGLDVKAKILNLEWIFLLEIHKFKIFHSKIHVADFTFMVCRINENRHTLSAYVFLR
jgi:hypothetical protein